MSDLNEAIESTHTAFRLAENDVDKAERAAELAMGMSLRFGQTGSIDNIKESITCGKLAVELTPTNQCSKRSHVFNLGTALCSRFGLMAVKDLDDGIMYLRAAAELISDREGKGVCKGT